MNPINRAIDRMLADQEERHAWLHEAGKQIRKWREEDARQTRGLSEGEGR